MNERILIVEDNMTVANILAHIAQSHGFDVVKAASLAEVESILAEDQDFFVASVDYNLPDAPDGEVLPFVLTKSIPSLVLTGRLDDATRDKILSYPVIDYIPKETAQAFYYFGRLLERLVRNRQIRVLVVDDSPSTRHLVTKLLVRHNFLVAEANNGEEALQKLKDHNDIKMVITDNEMPVMKGIKLVSEIRKDHDKDDLAIIGISSHGAGTLSARFIKNGANDFLTKPFYNEEFYCRVLQNIEHLENIEKIRKAANEDFLTNLSNRRHFFEQAPQIIAKQQGENISVAMLDIDFFKKINDTYGHEAGDAVLKEFARRLQRHFPNELIARFGGEEFCIVFSTITYEDAIGRLEFLRHHVESKPTYFNAQPIEMSVSAGIVSGSENLTEMINDADACLYQAKEQGRNQVISA